MTQPYVQLPMQEIKGYMANIQIPNRIKAYGKGFADTIRISHGTGKLKSLEAIGVYRQLRRTLFDKLFRVSRYELIYLKATAWGTTAEDKDTVSTIQSIVYNQDLSHCRFTYGDYHPLHSYFKDYT